MDKYIILFIILIVSILSKNKGLLYATIVILSLTILPYQDKTLGFFRSKGLNMGVFMLTVAILSPIALGQVSSKNLIETFTSYQGIIAVVVGIMVSVVSTQGIVLQTISPNIVIAISIGTIIGIVALGGTATGPIIASGISYVIIKIVQRYIGG